MKSVDEVKRHQTVQHGTMGIGCDAEECESDAQTGKRMKNDGGHGRQMMYGSVFYGAFSYGVNGGGRVEKKVKLLVSGIGRCLKVHFLVVVVKDKIEMFQVLQPQDVLKN